jgi:hypothetical protein
MEALLFVRPLNGDKYDGLGSKEFVVSPRENEFISLEVKSTKKYFQVIAVHHATGAKPAVEIYAVQTEPTWEQKKKRGIGFGV